MFQQTIAAKLVKKNRFFYGWIIVAVASLSVFFSGPGQTYFISIFINSYIKDFNWNRSTVSSLYSASTLLSGLLLFIVGRLADRYGKKRMTIIAAALLGTACMWSSFISNLPMLFVGFFLGRLSGQGSMTLIPSTLVPQWFIKKRAFALSLMSIGGVIGSALIPPFNTWLIGSWGWNNTWRLWSVLLWFLFIPVVYFLQYDSPEELGLLPDNDTSPHEVEDDAIKQNFMDNSWTLKEAMGTRTFWFMLSCQLVLPMIVTGIMFHFISILGTKGLSASSAALVLSIISLVSFALTLVAGYILDRVKVHYVTAFSLFLELLAIIILINTRNVYTAIAFAALQGAATGLNSVAGSVVWPNYYGKEHLGSIRGLIMTAAVISSSFGPLPFGIAFDLLGGYTEILIIMSLFPAIGIVAALLSPSPRKNKKALRV